MVGRPRFEISPSWFLQDSKGYALQFVGHQASVNTKLHAIYAYFFLGFTVAKISTVAATLISAQTLEAAQQNCL